jgi:Fe-S cluster assembly iron-binding protein IscA
MSNQKTKNRANLYNDPAGYYDVNRYNPRSRTTMTQGHYEAPRDSRIVADKIPRTPIHTDEILRTQALNDADPVRMYKTMNAFKPFSIYLDFSHCNASDNNEDGIYKYNFSKSSLRSNNSDKFVTTSSALKMKGGFLKMPSYLLDPSLNYDMSEIFINFMNIPPSFNNGIDRYHFKMLPTQVLTVSDPAKTTYAPEFNKFDFTLPQLLDEYLLELRDKAGRILVPFPIVSGIMTIGNPTIITGVHGAQTGFLVYKIKFRNGSITPDSLGRIYPITVLDPTTFTIPVDTSSLTYLNNESMTYLIDNFNFEFNLKVLNINWDNDHTFSGKK